VSRVTPPQAARPAFYALAPGRARDLVTLLHPPYTAWHLSYAAIGAGLAPEMDLGRLGLVLSAFFLAVGIAAHALDELVGRPLSTGIPRTLLAALAGVSLAGAAAIGIGFALATAAWILLLVPVGVFLVLAYNLEWVGGRFHTDAWFGLAWGSFPLVTGYAAMAQTLRPAALAGAVFAYALSRAQRSLSTVARHVRRDVVRVEGALERRDGGTEPLSAERLLEAPEAALRAMTVAVLALAVGLVVMRAL
jgi:hypothetical protein